MQTAKCKVQSGKSEHRIPISALCILHSALCIGLSGCEIPALLLYKVSGPPAVKARYVPPKEPMLVLVEGRGEPASLEAEQLGIHIAQQLKRRDVAPLIDPTALYELRSASPQKFRAMSIAAVGRELGAAQVLYVDLTESSVRELSGSGMLRGQLSARVRVVDARSGATRWPSTAARGYPLELETPYLQPADGANAAHLRRQMHESMAERIAKLFYTWKPDNESPPE